ncbi:MAG: hypothetical protein SGARI_006739, partial [Bacillariaceae sp.]
MWFVFDEDKDRILSDPEACFEEIVRRYGLIIGKWEVGNVEDCAHAKVAPIGSKFICWVDVRDLHHLKPELLIEPKWFKPLAEWTDGMKQEFARCNPQDTSETETGSKEGQR